MNHIRSYRVREVTKMRDISVLGVEWRELPKSRPTAKDQKKWLVTTQPYPYTIYPTSFQKVFVATATS